MTASRRENHADRRKSYRCAVQGARRCARLRIDGRNVDARVLDESAEGLAVQVEGTPDCKIGDTILLEIAAAWLEVRVINLHLTESVPDDSQDAEPVTATRMGLVRLREVEESLIDPNDFPLLSAARIRSLLVPLVPLGKSVKGTAAAIVAIIVVGAVIVWLLEHSAPLAEAMREHAAEQDDKLQGLGERLAPIIEKKTGDSSSSKPAKRDTEPPPAESKPQKTSSPSPALPAPPKGVVRLAHPDFLLKPQVTKLLSLRRKQREQLRRLFEQYKTALAESGSRASPSGNDPLAELRRRAWEILTDKQRESLAQLHTAMQTMPDADLPGAPATERDDAPSRGAPADVPRPRNEVPASPPVQSQKG